MADNNFKTNVDALLNGMESFLSTKTVVGEAVQVGGNILLPLADVSFGVGAGAFEGNDKSRGGGGMGAKISPAAVLVINEAGTRIIPVKNDNTLTKLIDMAPDLINKFKHRNDKVEFNTEDLFEENE